MFCDVVAVDTGLRDLESLRVVALPLPWAFTTFGHGIASNHRRARAVGAPQFPYRPGHPPRPDPASDGTSHQRARVPLLWFPLREDGLSDEFPLLSRVSILRTTRFSHDELAALHAEVEQIMPNLIGDDALLFDGLNFLIEEVLAHGRGDVEFRPELV
ncbi:MAG: hypothetical protein CVT64_11110 [Actinobacteria bacterium HGW-Actinobacteria-4]|nr:MAG: hypothetical protein CVT64_11110 [Actinobacteria bacterium HGW-Actinobacteria-4]